MSDFQILQTDGCGHCEKCLLKELQETKARLAEETEERRTLAKQLDKRAAGTDPLTKQLRERCERAETALHQLDELLIVGNVDRAVRLIRSTLNNIPEEKTSARKEK